MTRAGVVGNATSLLAPPGISTGAKPMEISELMAISSAEVAACIAQ
jgi:hypothetical protein